MTGQASRACRALAHPARRALLMSLAAGECDVSKLEGLSELDQPTVSKHLGVLREAGLVEARVDGRRRCYSLVNPDLVKPLLALLKQLDEAPTASLSDPAPAGKAV